MSLPWELSGYAGLYAFEAEPEISQNCAANSIDDYRRPF